MNSGEAGFAALADRRGDTPATDDPELARLASIVSALRRSAAGSGPAAAAAPSPEFRARLRARLLARASIAGTAPDGAPGTGRARRRPGP